MKTITRDGLILCELQATAFEKSVDCTDCSSEIFIRRFMHSEVARTLDNESILDSNYQAADIIQMINEEYGVSNYGSVKYQRDELFWIGYIYRYYVITYDLLSIQAYKRIKPKELREMYLPYHTMAPSQAIERILEAKGLLLDEEAELRRQYEIYRRIRLED